MQLCLPRPAKGCKCQSLLIPPTKIGLLVCLPPCNLKMQPRSKITSLDEAKKEEHQPHTSSKKLLALLEGKGKRIGNAT